VNRLIVALLAAGLLALAGCGLKGPLYLPEKTGNVVVRPGAGSSPPAAEPAKPADGAAPEATPPQTPPPATDNEPEVAPPGDPGD
jgi:predicted small lipoprotein YifL